MLPYSNLSKGHGHLQQSQSLCVPTPPFLRMHAATNQNASTAIIITSIIGSVPRIRREIYNTDSVVQWKQAAVLDSTDSSLMQMTSARFLVHASSGMCSVCWHFHQEYLPLRLIHHVRTRILQVSASNCISKSHAMALCHTWLLHACTCIVHST